MSALSSSFISKITDRLGLQFSNLKSAILSNHTVGSQGSYYALVTRSNDYNQEYNLGALASVSASLDAQFGTINDFDKFYSKISTTYVDFTKGVATITGYPYVINPSTTPTLYFGSTSTKFNNISSVVNSLNGLNCSISSSNYWNGAWAALSISDGTSNFTQSGAITFTPQTDWTAVSLNTADSVTVDSTARYWVKLALSNAASNTVNIIFPPQYFVPSYSNFTFTAGTLIGALLTQIRGSIDPVTGVNYLSLDAYCADNPVPIRVSANFAQLMTLANGTNLLASSVMPDQTYTFGTYNLASGLTQTGTYKLASASPNPTPTTVASTLYSLGTSGTSNSVNFSGTQILGTVTTVLNGTCTLQISGFGSDGNSYAYSAGTAGWLITMASTTLNSTATAVAQGNTPSRCLLIQSVAKSGAGTTGIITLTTQADRTPSL